MKPTVIAANANAGATGPDQAGAAPNGMNIPINREYANSGNGAGSFGSPKTHMRQQQPQQQNPAHFQHGGFGFEPDMDMDMDMFPRSRLGRAHHDPFAGFGGSHFGFPQFGSMGRRRAAGGNNDPMADDDDFFNRLPSEFRQYIPETFGQRRGASNIHQPHHQQQQHPHYAPPNQPQPAQYYQGGYAPTGNTPPTQYFAQPNDARNVPQSPSKRLCDAAIQTDEVDHIAPDQQGQGETLNQHGLRNTVDLGVKSTFESDPGARSHSAPPPEQQNLQYQQQNIPVNGKRPTPPPGVQQQFGTQTSPQMQSNFGGQYPQPPPTQAHRSYYAPQQQSHPQQSKQQTPPPPQTPGGSYIRTIPIFVEGRTEPVINSHKEIPNQNAGGAASATASATASAQSYAPQQQHPQQQRPAPLNTQQSPQLQPQAGGSGLPPQTPHTLDSINKIQDIQRDVLELMGKVEKFGGLRQDREYIYLDEMLTRNLLKLDTIDTNGKESIRLARKEAIKCIQASINVLEAKAEENANNKSGEASTTNAAADVAKSSSTEKATASTGTEATAAAPNEEATEAADAKKVQEAIPLPPPPTVEQTSENVGETESAESSAPKAEGTGTEQDAREATPTNNQVETK